MHFSSSIDRPKNVRNELEIVSFHDIVTSQSIYLLFIFFKAKVNEMKSFFRTSLFFLSYNKLKYINRRVKVKVVILTQNKNINGQKAGVCKGKKKHFFSMKIFVR